MKHTSGSHAIRSAFAACVFALMGALGALTSQGAHASAPAPDQSTAVFEERFLQEMIDHHMMAAHMSHHLCLAKAVHQELRALCQEIVDEQHQEIMTMQQWLASWYGIANYQPAMPQDRHMEKLALLNNAEFEMEFMKQMIRHHRMTIVKASQCVERAYHPELQDSCADMITGQLDEIRRMQEWLCTWYGICRPRRSS